MTDEKERDRLMAMVPDTLPVEVDKWLRDVCLKDHEYIFYDKKTNYAFCTHCDKQIDKRFLVAQDAKHNEKDICPICGAQIDYVCIGIFRHHELKTYTFQIRIAQSTPEGIVIRRFQLIRKCIRSQENTIQTELGYAEIQRVFNNGDKIKKYTSRYCYPDYDKKCWGESKRREFTLLASMGWQKWLDDYEYKANLDQVLESSPLRYAKRNETLDYYSDWLKQFEYLEKMKMDNLLKDLINGFRCGINLRGKTLEKFFRLPKEYIQFAKVNDLSAIEIDRVRWLLKVGVKKIDAAFVKYGCSEFKVYFEKILTSDMPINMIIKYWTNKLSPSYIDRTLYRDYVGFCEKLNYDMTDPSILFPKDLKEAHDREMVRIKVSENKEKSEKIEKRFKFDNKKYGFAYNSLFIRPPKNMAEILNEGSKLSHCVGSYADRVAENKTTILFVRRMDRPEEPFYTVEWNGKLIQIRGKQNCVPTPEVAEFMEQWEARNQKKERVSVKAV